MGYSLQNRSVKAASPLTLHQIPQRTSSIDAAAGVEKQPYRHRRNSVTVFSKQTGPFTGGRHLGLMLRCLATVPRLRSHQHQKLQSSSYCFHCSTTCSPTHSHVHTHTRALTHSVTTPTSVSPNPLLLLSLLLLSLSPRGSPPISPFPFPISSSPFSPLHSGSHRPAKFAMLLTRSRMQQYPPTILRHVCTTTLTIMSWIHIGCLVSHT